MAFDYAKISNPMGRGKENREQKIKFWTVSELEAFIAEKQAQAVKEVAGGDLADARRDYSACIRALYELRSRRQQVTDRLAALHKAVRDLGSYPVNATVFSPEAG